MNHDAVTIGVPVLAILFAALINRAGLHRLEDHRNKRWNSMEARFEACLTAMEARFDAFYRDFHVFHSILGEHRAKLDRLETFRLGALIQQAALGAGSLLHHHCSLDPHPQTYEL